MREPFRSKIRITQAFGVNKVYYSKFGLEGHEGLDLVPTGTSWDVLALADGVVVKDQDDAIQGKAYGKYLTLWHPNIKKATQYCHLEYNSVKLGDTMTQGQVIGKMGATGNVTGAHLHLNLFETDDSGYRLNKDNGFLGGIDPVPFLNETTQESGDWQTKYFAVKAELNERDAEKRMWEDITRSVAGVLNVPAEKEIMVAETQKFIKLEGSLIAKDKELVIKDDKVTELQAQLIVMQKENDDLAKENKDEYFKIEEQGFALKKLQDEFEEYKKQKPMEQHTISDHIKAILRKLWGGG